MPAMWSDSSKQRMRRAALRAGLIRSEDSDALTIILEPEAAVLHCLDNRAPPLLPGMNIQRHAHADSSLTAVEQHLQQVQAVHDIKMSPCFSSLLLACLQGRW